MRDRSNCPALFALFDTVRPISAAALKALTGQDFGEDAAKWRAWWEANGEK